MVACSEEQHNRGMDERRSEPRYLVTEEAFVWDLNRLKAGYHTATIVDVSRNGMQLESRDRYPRGSYVGVDFRGMIICGTVQHCKPIRGRFSIGIQIKDLMDPLGQEPVDDLAVDESSAQAAVASH